MTKRENFEMIMATVVGLPNETEIKEFCEKEIANLEKKNASNEARKLKKAEEHEELENAILGVFAEGVKSATTKEIADELGLKFQKITPRLKTLVEKGILVRTQEKKSIFFTMAETPSESVEETE